jgi:hypothetical protein
MKSSTSREGMNVSPAILTATGLTRSRSRRNANMLTTQRIAEWPGSPDRKLQSGLVAITVGADAETNATPRPTRTAARN